MYLEFENIGDKNQKEIYFLLDKSLKIEKDYSVKKISGLYAIFKDEICLYVGKSTNLPSRISTHLSGKYSDCVDILLFDITSFGFSDFFERDKESQTEILDNNEKYLMTIFKPIENIDIDMDLKIDEELVGTFSFVDEEESYHDIYQGYDEDYDKNYKSNKAEIKTSAKISTIILPLEKIRSIEYIGVDKIFDMSIDTNNKWYVFSKDNKGLS